MRARHTPHFHRLYFLDVCPPPQKKNKHDAHCLFADLMCVVLCWPVVAKEGANVVWLRSSINPAVRAEIRDCILLQLNLNFAYRLSRSCHLHSPDQAEKKMSPFGYCTLHISIQCNQDKQDHQLPFGISNVCLFGAFTLPWWWWWHNLWRLSLVRDLFKNFKLSSSKIANAVHFFIIFFEN